MELSRHVGTCDTFSVQVLLQILNNSSLEVESSHGDTIYHTLNVGRDSAQDPQFVASKTELLAHQVGHLETKTMDEVEVDESRRG